MPTAQDVQDFLSSPMAQIGIGMLGSNKLPGDAYQQAAAAAQQQQQSQLQQQAQALALQQAHARMAFNPSQYLLSNQAAQQQPQAAGPATQAALAGTPGGGQIAANTQTPYAPPPGAIGNVDMAGLLRGAAQAGISPEEAQGMAGVIDPMTAIRMKLMSQPALVVPPGGQLVAPGVAQLGQMQGGVAAPAGAAPGTLATNTNPPADSPLAQIRALQTQRDQFPVGSPNYQMYDAAVNKVTGSWEQGNPEDINTVGDAIGHYEMAPLSGNALRSPISQKVMAYVGKNYPGYNAQNYAASQEATNNFASGPLGDKTRQMNVAINHLDVLKDAATALGNGDMKGFNQARQEYLQQTGSAIPTNFDTVHQMVANEVVKAVSGASGGTQSERDEMKENIDKASSFSQLQGAIDQSQKLLGGQLQGLAKQYQGATMGRTDFAQKYLSSRTQKVIGNGEGEGGASAPTNAQAGGFPLTALQAELQKRGLLKQ